MKYNRLLILLVALVVITYIIEKCGYGNEIREKFGALQSLYSNDGIQDQHLTGNTEKNGYDPYGYWKDIVWNLPTRNLNKIVYYPFFYEQHEDRYVTNTPYW